MKIYIMVAVLATGMLFACHRANSGKEIAATTNTEIADIKAIAPIHQEISSPEEQLKTSRTLEPPSPSSPPQKDPQPVPADYSKQIIRNAKISFEVKNAQSVSASVSEAVRLNGGYIASANEVQLAGEIRHEMTIRVPREKFDELLNRISGYADTLLQKNITSQDVTEEYVDTKARITAKEKTKERYYDFLKQAKNIDEVLKVQSEIGDLQEEIEAASGRVNYIKHQAALSTIVLSFFEPLPAAVSPPETPPGFWKEVALACADGWEIVKILTLAIIKIWPLWVAVIVVWSIIRRRKTVLNTAKQ
ncbi:MAG: DUF4349 domain-containing protein [Agriterribacter sp.]